MAWMEDDSETFVNPYNFIRIRDHECKREEFEKGNLTGVIECLLITKTPTIIPNTSNNNALKEVFIKDGKNVAKTYNFFSYDDLSQKNMDSIAYYEPVIPGSEIRGVIRSAYEAVTNSCMSAIDIDRPLHQRSTRVKQYAGRLVKQNGNWMIHEADVYMVKSKDCPRDPMDKINIKDYDEGEQVYIEISDEPYKENMPKTVTRIGKEDFDGAIKESSYIHIGEDIFKKHHERVFVPKNTSLIPVDEEVVNNFRKLLKLYSNDKLNRNKKFSPMNVKKHTGYKNVKVEEGALVYYDVDDKGNVKYLTPAPITREVFNRKAIDILGDFVPCEKRKQKNEKDLMCDGCRLFGMISTDKDGKSLGSRIRFSDAKVSKKLNNKDYYFGDRVINELSSPKISSTEFYMEEPDEEFDTWNYDYAIKWPSGRVLPTPIPISEVYVKGRKFYWHHNPKDIEPRLNDRNNKVRILKSNNEFKFDIYFEDITREELEKLIWTLTIGGKENNYHKIGKGKPLGYGSIKIKVKDIFQRNVIVEDGTLKHIIDKLNIYNNEAEINGNIKIKSNNVEEFLIISDFTSTKNATVCYPIGKAHGNNATAGYQWFIGNRFNTCNGGAMKPKIRYLLPEIKKPAGVLYKLVKY